MAMSYSIFLLNIFLMWCISSSVGYSDDDEYISEGNGVLSDDLLEDDHEEFELSDIIALSALTPDISTDHPTPEERKLVVDMHNVLRRNYSHPFPNVSNIPMFEYNNTLEWSSGEMLKLCVYAHVFGPNENGTGLTGQNIYRGTSNLASRAVYNFYHKEIDYYNFNNFTCQEHRAEFGCGHFVTECQALSERVGYDKKSNCFPRDGTWMHTYEYFIGGYLWGPELSHFKYGPPCTRCKPGYYCATGLCVPDPKRQCKDYNLDCECVRVCHNCATPDWKNCRCSPCKVGWDWDDCSYPCYDWNDWYLKDPWKCWKQWDHRCWTDVTPYFVNERCRRRCGKCFIRERRRRYKQDELCCGGKVCERFFILDLDTCECKELVPNRNNLYPYNFTTTTTSTTTTTTTSTTSTTTPTTTSTTSTTTPTTTSTTTITTTTEITSSTTPATTNRSKMTSASAEIVTSYKNEYGKEPRPVGIASMIIPYQKTLLLAFIIVLFFIKV